ncbi:TPA: DUF6162 family protein [Photobacterium damselae]
MITQSVRSDNGGREGKWVALSIATILAVSASLLPYHQAAQEEQLLAAHQQAVADLNTENIAMVAELRLAHEEIRNLYTDNQIDSASSKLALWPDLKELEALWLAPFVQDQSWERKGKHQWEKVTNSVYFGMNTLQKGANSVVLISEYEEPEIWFAQDFDNAMTATSLSSFTDLKTIRTKLIADNWQQVVFDSHSASHQH